MPKIETIRVKLLAADGQEIVINACNFDPELHAHIKEEKAREKPQGEGDAEKEAKPVSRKRAKPKE